MAATWASWLIVLGAAPAGAQFRVDVQGLDEPLRAAVVDALVEREPDEASIAPARARYLLNRGAEEIRQTLQRFGYFDPSIDSELIETGRGDYRARYRIDAGEPVRVRSIDVAVGARAANIPTIERAVGGMPLREGERFDYELYETGKREIASALRTAGFLDAELVTHRARVDTEALTADIDLAWRPGVRYRLGEVHFDDDVPFSARFLQGYVPWEPGDHYSPDELLTLQQRLVDADYFSAVSVQPLLDERSDGVVPVRAALQPAKRNVYWAGVHYGTDHGVGGHIEYERRWLNIRGHKLATRLEHSEQLQRYTVTYRIPRPGPTRSDWAFGLAYRFEESPTVDARALRLAATDTRGEWRGFTRTLGVHLMRGDFEIGTQRGHASILYSEASLSRLRYDDLSFPREGYLLELGLRVAPETMLSATRLTTLWANGRRLFRSGERNRWLLGARLGATAVDDFSRLPPELRFFAGGDRSLRGFEHQEIGERGASGEVIGGRYLATASVEYEHYFSDRWGAATFVDTGDAFSQRFDIKAAVGIGLRWRSLIGMVRVDVAKPVVTDRGDAVRLHITVGPDL